MDSVRLNGLLAKLETLYKQDSVPAPTTDGVQVEEHIWSRIEWGHLEQNLRDTAAQFGFGRVSRAQPSGPFIHITALVALRGAGAAYSDLVRPPADVLLRISGNSATVDDTLGTETVTYAPIRENFESASVYAYGGGLLFKAVGCRAILTSVSVLPNQLVRATFDIWGVLTSMTEASLPVIAYPGVRPPEARNEGLTLDAFDPAGFSSFEFRQGMELPAAPSGNDPDGHAGYVPADMVPTFLATIPRPPFASFNPFTLRNAGTRFPWDIGPVGPQQYNRFTLSGPAARITEVPPEDQNGFAMMRIEARAENTDEATFDPYQLIFD